MKATSRYSRSTTKKAIDAEKDPYLLKASPANMSVCTRCTAVYYNKRWQMVDRPAAGKAKRQKVLCPACQKIKDGFVAGYVTIKGDFVKAHAEEITNLVRNKEKRAIYHNPLDRIIKIKTRRGIMEVTTTTEKLAQRIGQMLKKAYNGSVEYKWSSDVKMARVVWTR